MEKKRRSKGEKLSILKEAESQGIGVTIIQHGCIHLLSTAGVRRKLSFPLKNYTCLINQGDLSSRAAVSIGSSYMGQIYETHFIWTKAILKPFKATKIISAGINTLLSRTFSLI